MTNCSGSAATNGETVFGSASAQSNYITQQGVGAANPQAGTLPYANFTGGKRRVRKGRKSAKKMGGSTLVNIAVPAALMYANQAYKPKGAHVSFRRGRSGRSKSSKRRGSRSRRRRH